MGSSRVPSLVSSCLIGRLSNDISKDTKRLENLHAKILATRSSSFELDLGVTKEVELCISQTSCEIDRGPGNINFLTKERYAQLASIRPLRKRCDEMTKKGIEDTTNFIAGFDPENFDIVREYVVLLQAISNNQAMTILSPDFMKKTAPGMRETFEQHRTSIRIFIPFQIEGIWCWFDLRKLKVVPGSEFLYEAYFCHPHMINYIISKELISEKYCHIGIELHQNLKPLKGLSENPKPGFPPEVRHEEFRTFEDIGRESDVIMLWTFRCASYFQNVTEISDGRSLIMQILLADLVEGQISVNVPSYSYESLVEDNTMIHKVLRKVNRLYEYFPECEAPVDESPQSRGSLEIQPHSANLVLRQKHGENISCSSKAEVDTLQFSINQRM